MADMKIKELEQMIGYTFRDPQMLLTAMCHSSYANGGQTDEAACEYCV